MKHIVIAESGFENDKEKQAKIEKCWTKARKLAIRKYKPSDNEYEKYVERIFKNMLSLSAEDEVLAGFVSESARNAKWWDGLTRRQQLAYIKEHPKSKHAKNIKSKDATGKKLSTKEQAVAQNTVQMHEDEIVDSVKDDIGEEDLEKGLDVLNALPTTEDEEQSTDETPEETTEEEPAEDETTEEPPTEEEPVTKEEFPEEEEDTDEEPAATPKGPQSAERIPLTAENIKIAKAVIGSIAKSVLGVLAVAALFTPLLPLVLDIGDMYYKHKYGENEVEGEEDEVPVKKKKAKRQATAANTRKDTKFFVKDFTQWLVSQDIEELAAAKAEDE
jgi:hypothetical protein